MRSQLKARGERLGELMEAAAHNAAQLEEMRHEVEEVSVADGQLVCKGTFMLCTAWSRGCMKADGGSSTQRTAGGDAPRGGGGEQ